MVHKKKLPKSEPTTFNVHGLYGGGHSSKLHNSCPQPPFVFRKCRVCDVHHACSCCSALGLHCACRMRPQWGFCVDGLRRDYEMQPRGAKGCVTFVSATWRPMDFPRCPALTTPSLPLPRYASPARPTPFPRRSLAVHPSIRQNHASVATHSRWTNDHYQGHLQTAVSQTRRQGDGAEQKDGRMRW